MTIIPFPEPKEQPACCGKRNLIKRLCLPVASRSFARIKFDKDQPEPAKPLLPMEVLTQLEKNLRQRGVPDVVELGGSGDPLTDPDTTLEILTMLHGKHPEIDLGIKTLGVNGELLAPSLVKSGVKQVTMVIDAIDQSVMQELYAWIRPGKKTVPLSKAVAILQDEQLRALQAFCRAGIKVTVKTTVYPGFNDKHIDEVVYRAERYGAEAMMIVPYKPHGDGEGMPGAPNGEMMDLIHSRAAKRIKVVGSQGSSEGDLVTLHTDLSLGQSLPKPTKERPRVAVVSSNGMDVDMHLGHAINILIYGPREDGLICLLESREAPEPGGGGSRWEALADILSDCFVLLTASAGENPRKILGCRGISVKVIEGEIEGIVDVLYGGGKKKGRKK